MSCRMLRARSCVAFTVWELTGFPRRLLDDPFEALVENPLPLGSWAEDDDDDDDPIFERSWPQTAS